MAEKLVFVDDPQLIQSGIVKSMHKLQVPLWIDGQNVVFEDGSVRKSPGRVQIFDTPIIEPPVLGVQDVLVDETPNLIFGDMGNLYRYDGEAVTTDGTGYSGTVDRSAFQLSAFQDTTFQAVTVRLSSIWSMLAWGEWGIASNGVDAIQINKMAGAGFVALTGTPPSHAQIIVKFINYVLAFNTDLGGAYFEWCDTDNVEDWVNGAAGYLYIRDLDSDIVCACKMGDVIAVYSSNTMAIVQYLGPDFYFGAKLALKGIGAVGKLSVIERDKQNYGISQQGIWRTDGTGYVYISPPLIREWLETHVNWGHANQIAGFDNEDRSLLEWGIPVDGSSENNLTICYNYSTQAWTFRDYGITCGLAKNNFIYPIFGLSSGEVMFGEYLFDANGLPVDAWVQTRPMQGGDALFWKSVEYITVGLRDLIGEVSVYIGVQEKLTDEILWSNAFIVDEGMNPSFTDNLKALDGKYISFKIQSNELGGNFKLSSFNVFGSLTGAEV